MAKSFLGGLRSKAFTEPVQNAAARRRTIGMGPRAVSYGSPMYQDGWSVERAISDGMQRSVWAYQAITTLSKHCAVPPIDIRKGTPRVNDRVDPPNAPHLWHRLNVRSSLFEYAMTFRWRLMSQLLMSRRGVFIEYDTDAAGEIESLWLLNPDKTAPIPHPTKFVEGYEITHDDGQVVRIGADKVLWIRIPHPTNPWASLTPLDAAGISIDIDFYMRLYNRNFMANDGRPAGLLTISGGLSDDDADIIKGRFSGNAEPGRVTVIEAENSQFQDLATTPRDASYNEGRKIAQSDVLGAFGVPKSQTGDSSGITQDQVESEEFQYWRNTVQPLNHLLELAFGSLTVGGDTDDLWVRHDYSEIRALQRPQREDEQRAIEGYRDGLRTINDVLDTCGKDRIDLPGFNTYFIAAGKVGVPGPDEPDIEAVKALPVIGAAVPEMGDDAQQRLPGSPGAPRIAALLTSARGDNLQNPRTPISMGQAQPTSTPALPSATSPERDAARAADEASRVAQRRDVARVSKADDLDLETKAKRSQWNMVSIDLPGSEITPLFRGSPVPTIDPAKAHITMTLSDGGPLDDTTMTTVQEWAASTAPFNITVGPDLDTFPKGDDGVPVFYPVRSDGGLPTARASLKDALVGAGKKITEYDEYRPHVTVAYMADAPASLEPARPVFVAHRVTEVAVSDGSNVVRVPLGGGGGPR